MRFIVSTTLLFIVFSISMLQAQIIETAPAHNPTLRAYAIQKQIQGIAYREGNDTLSLPFMDDFSYESSYPSSENWCDQAVFVNNTLSNNPPSVGVATFDGLDRSGSPYALSGSSDTLTSNNFFLGEYTSTDDVYLSLYYQAKGDGDRPETNDSLILEFKNNADIWSTINNWEGISTSQPESFTPDFTFYSIAISEDYLYDGFQFRLRNLSSGKGQVDLWHVDYIRLTASVIPSENFNDIAFTEVPTTFLKNYSSMPWRQYEGFEDAETTNGYSITLFNHFPDVQEMQSKVLNIEEITTNTNVLNTSFLLILGNVIPGTHIQENEFVDTGSFNSFKSAMQSQFAGAEELVFETRFNFIQSGENPAFPATINNNLIVKKTKFSNYFAYDDGTAESNIKAQNPGTDVAVKYHLNVGDSIRAIQMHIPHIAGDVTLQLFNIKVYQNLDEDPLTYSANFQSPVYVDEFVAADTLQGMTTYVLKDNLGNPTPIYLPAGDFYIGWEQVTDTETPIPIGFDKNNPSAGINNYYNAGGGWEEFPATLQGAIMIRPVVGEAVVFNTSIDDLKASSFFNIYPNPANEVLAFNTLNDDDFYGGIEMFDSLGRKVWTSEYQEFIPVIDFAPGIYFVQITEWETGVKYNAKIAVQR
jgi:hypothetical protein